MPESGTAKNTSFSTFDLSCMKRAFKLARRGMGKTSPNPMVGAVIAKGGGVIGEGWHRSFGGAHAEAEAVKAALDAGFSPRSAELYCTLEPCCFDGPGKHQPPCVSLIIKSGIKKVCIANTDPNPKVSGKGISMLKEAGIRVRTGLCAEEGEELNRAFFTFHRMGRPYIHIKIAQSLDGRIAAPDGGARWITDEAARTLVHRLRSRCDAVLIGRGTALADDPELTVRLVKGRNPRRVVLDSRLSIPADARLLGQAPGAADSGLGETIIIHGHDADTGKAQALRSSGAVLIPVKAAGAASNGLALDDVLAALAGHGIQSVLIEGGSGVFSSFLREGLWDRLSVFIAPLIIGGGVNAVSGLGFSSMTEVTEAMRFKNGSFRRVGTQILFEVNRETK